VSRAWLVALLFAVGCHTTTPREHALLLLSRGQIRDGVVELEKLRDAEPRNPGAWIDLGHGYELLHRYDDALAAYDEAAHVAPNDPRGPREGGLRAAKWGEHQAARARLEEALRRGDDEPATYHALGVVRLQLGDRKGAREAYTAGMRSRNGERDATNVLGLATLAVVEDNPKEALGWYEELIKRRPRVAAPHLGRAWALGRLGRFDEANQAIDAALALGALAEDCARMRRFVAEQRAKLK
jgi:Flp pilus assembly protein TadD